MYERCLNEAERLLATSKDVVIPIKEVWKSLAAEGKRRSFEVPALTDFDALLEGDKRFEILSAQTEPDQIELLLTEEGEELDSNLGTLGFYPEDRVKLRRIKLPGTASPNAGSRKESEDDEEVVPFNVRGLSATKPVHPLETKKQNPRRKATKSKSRSKSSTKLPSKKRTKKAVVKRTVAGKLSRRTR
jgi:hypothetical protein